jgi:CarD family transcriptional regulator
MPVPGHGWTLVNELGGEKMFRIGDLIIYGNTGVCEVTDITERNISGTGKETLYYVLEPLYQNCTIFAPTNNKKIFMRPIISKEEAERLINMIPSMDVKIFHSSAISQLTEHYKASLETHDCTNLLELCMSLHAKKQAAEQQKRKFGAVDEKFKRCAEDLLFGELAAALGIEREQVSECIADRIEGERRYN